MLRFEICCILPSDSDDVAKCVAAVGGKTQQGSRWLLPQADAVDGAERGRWSFFVLGRDGQPIDIVVGVTEDGTHYLKGEKDALAPSTLLLLPRCKLSDLKLPMPTEQKSA